MNVLTRCVVGAVLIAVMGIVLAFGSPLVDVVAVVVVLLGLWEIDQLLRRIGAAPMQWLLLTLGVWFCLGFAFNQRDMVLALGIAVAIVGGCIGSLIMRRDFVAWAVSVGGALYVGYGVGSYVGVVHSFSGHVGSRLVVLVIATVIASDTAAYAIGTAIGKRLMYPTLSPSKTVEGTVGGAVCATLTCVIVATLWFKVPIVASLPLGGMIAIVAHAGDLVESALKRRAGVKDSGNLLPGHGGVVDRIDSLILVGPMAFWYLHFTAQVWQ